LLNKLRLKEDKNMIICLNVQKFFRQWKVIKEQNYQTLLIKKNIIKDNI